MSLRVREYRFDESPRNRYHSKTVSGRMDRVLSRSNPVESVLASVRLKNTFLEIRENVGSVRWNTRLKNTRKRRPRCVRLGSTQLLRVFLLLFKATKRSERAVSSGPPCIRVASSDHGQSGVDALSRLLRRFLHAELLIKARYRAFPFALGQPGFDVR